MKKIGNSFGGIIGGIIFILIGIGILWWNEGNNVKNLKTTNEMTKACIDVKSDKVDPANDGKLVATSGKLLNEQELNDTTFAIKVKTPLLKRIVEVYQWEEESETDEDDNTTYHYKKVWSDRLIDSSDFHKKGYDNPTQKLYEDETFVSTDVKVGAFSLSKDQIESLSTEANVTEFNEEKATSLKLTASGKYLTNSENINEPQIGDTRISFEYNNSTEVSVLAVQTGSTFTSFVSKAGKHVNRVMDGTKSGKEMINIIKKENNFLKWLLRLLGTILCIAGFGAVLKPISTITGFVPILGSVVGAAVGLVSFVLGLSVSLVVIAIAWIRFRPLLGIGLLVVVAILLFFLFTKGKKNKSEQPVQNPQPQPVDQPIQQPTEQPTQNVEQPNNDQNNPQQ